MVDTSIIIAASAVGGSAIGAIGAAFACRPWQDWTIKRINKDRADLRRGLTAEQRCVEIYATEIRVLRSERDEARKALALACKPDQPRDPITGRWLSKPIKSGSYTINKPDAKPTPDDGWIEWTGGECPVARGTRCQIRFRTGYEPGADTSPEGRRWDHRGGISDIIAYRIASEKEAA